MRPTKAYCITLDQSAVQRAQLAMQEIKRLGLDCSFAQGVNVKREPLSNLKELLSPRAYNELQRGRQVHEALSGLGSVGCYLAHLDLWKRCAQDKQVIAVFEDDVLFLPDAPQRLAQLLQQAETANCDILRLIYMSGRGQPISQDLQRVSGGWSTAAYVLTPKAAEVLVKHALPMEMHPDYYMDAIANQHGLNQYAPIVPLHIHRNLPSTVGHSSVLAGSLCSGSCSAWAWLLGACIVALIIFMLSV